MQIHLSSTFSATLSSLQTFSALYLVGLYLVFTDAVSFTMRRLHHCITDLFIWIKLPVCFRYTLIPSESALSCVPEVKLVGLNDQEKLTFLQGCPGFPGVPGTNGIPGIPGSKGEQGFLGAKGTVTLNLKLSFLCAKQMKQSVLI